MTEPGMTNLQLHLRYRNSIWQRQKLNIVHAQKRFYANCEFIMDFSIWSTTKIQDLFKIVWTMPYVVIAYLFINSLCADVSYYLCYTGPEKKQREY